MKRVTGKPLLPLLLLLDRLFLQQRPTPQLRQHHHQQQHTHHLVQNHLQGQRSKNFEDEEAVLKNNCGQKLLEKGIPKSKYTFNL